MDFEMDHRLVLRLPLLAIRFVKSNYLLFYRIAFRKKQGENI